jgi:hypothetical protein
MEERKFEKLDEARIRAQKSIVELKKNGIARRVIPQNES